MVVLLVVCSVSCGVIHYLHCVDVGHLCHYALSCIVDCRSLECLLIFGDDGDFSSWVLVCIGKIPTIPKNQQTSE